MNTHGRAAIWLAAFCFASVSVSALAAETSAALEQRVQTLERQVRELSERLNQLELPASAASPAAATSAPAPLPAPATSSGPPGWQSSANWKKMRAGMNQDQVLGLLGEPEKRSGGKYRQRWEYAGGSAWVEYDSGTEVNEWQAP